MTRRTCSSCSFWLGTTTFELGAGKVTWLDTPGQCRALPPQFSYGWPDTRHDDWCGSHKEHPPKAEELYPMGVNSSC